MRHLFNLRALETHIVGTSSLNRIKDFVLGTSWFWGFLNLPKAKLCPTMVICLRLTPCNRGIWLPLPPPVLREEMILPWSCPSSPGSISLRAQTLARSSEDAGTILCIGVILEKRVEHRLGKAYDSSCFPLKWSLKRVWVK